MAKTQMVFSGSFPKNTVVVDKIWDYSEHRNVLNLNICG